MTTKKISKAEYQKRLDRITEIFAGMVDHADEQSRTRCPYRDRHDRCTAEFSCRNQREDDPEKAPMCGHDGVFDYRTAWESNPRIYDHTKAKIRKIRGSAKRDAAKDKH